MMPVMKFRRNKQEAQRTKSHANIGVNENRLPLMEHGKDANCPFGETQREDRYQRDPHGQNLIDRMAPARGQPVKLLHAVVNGMESP